MYAQGLSDWFSLFVCLFVYRAKKFENVLCSSLNISKHRQTLLEISRIRVYAYLVEANAVHTIHNSCAFLIILK